jgi:hypothetical protein
VQDMEKKLFEMAMVKVDRKIVVARKRNRGKKDRQPCPAENPAVLGFRFWGSKTFMVGQEDQGRKKRLSGLGRDDVSTMAKKFRNLLAQKTTNL